jgi:hypothetical protein
VNAAARACLGCGAAIVAALVPATAAADDPAAGDGEFRCAERGAAKTPPFAHNAFVRTFAGAGGLASGPSTNVVFGTEIGHHPLGGALGTGFAFSSATDVQGRYTVLTPGVFAKLDLTYIFLSGIWATTPPNCFPFRLQLGSRAGLGISESFRRDPAPFTYVLLRPELQPFFDVEVPVDRDRVYSIVFRGLLDTSVNLETLFRWGFAIGLSYGWGDG